MCRSRSLAAGSRQDGGSRTIRVGLMTDTRADLALPLAQQAAEDHRRRPPHYHSSSRSAYQMPPSRRLSPRRQVPVRLPFGAPPRWHGSAATASAQLPHMPPIMPMGGPLAAREWWPRGGVPRSFGAIALLRQQQTQEILQSQLRRNRCGTALAGKRRTCQPDRDCLNHHGTSPWERPMKLGCT
jgi:hypothetical protein